MDVRQARLQMKMIVFLTVGFTLLPNLSFGQLTFDSRSDGSDGALDFTGQSGEIVFDPFAFSPVLDPDGDQIFHFTTINIPSGVTLRLRSDKLPNGPVYWLANGPVVIDGVIDMSGAPGFGTISGGSVLGPALPGPGGFQGGVGQSADFDFTAGGGPGGGQHAPYPNFNRSGGAAGYGTSGGNFAEDGPANGNPFLSPLIGGSGGGGGRALAGGGAGGGALLIASSESIVMSNGSVLSRGGENGRSGNNPYDFGGSGSGGAVRLLAPSITGTGTIDVRNGVNSSSEGLGRIRFDTHDYGLQSANINGAFRVARLTPNVSFLPEDNPRLVRVTSIAGVPVPEPSTGNIFMPDITIDSADPVTLEIAASKIPVGTIVRLQVWSDTDGLQEVESSPLAGTLEDSTASASVRFSPGASQLFVRATWTP